MKIFDRRLYNFLIIALLSFATMFWTFYAFHLPFDMQMVLVVIAVRMIASLLIFKDYSLSWSKSTPKTFLFKSAVYITAFTVYMPIYYGTIHIYVLVLELFTYLFAINFSMYSYNIFINRSKIAKTKTVVIYGAGKAGIKLEAEFKNMEYKVKYFCDDDKIIQNRSIDNIKVLSPEAIKSKLKYIKYELLVIAMPSVSSNKIKAIYNNMHEHFDDIQVLPPILDILNDQHFSTQLKDISVEDLLARRPKDLDNDAIASFVKNKTILITGAGGSIGSELVRQCVKFESKQIIMIDHSEYNLYTIEQEVLNTSGAKSNTNIVPILQSVTNKNDIQNTFETYKPDIVIHAAAYKHVPLVEQNISTAITNNILGTKNIIDVSCDMAVKEVILISTDKAVRPTNVMGTTKRICELYAQNKRSEVSLENKRSEVSLENKRTKTTDIVTVRFGNVLGSSGSVIPKFKEQIKNDQNITVTHKDITRYFMLIPEACELVLQAGAIGNGGEIFILDMGEPIKIIDMAYKMIEISGKNNLKVDITGLRAGEKLYEELLIDDSEAKTKYESITVAKPTYYEIEKLDKDIDKLLQLKDDKQIVAQLKHIVPEFNHNNDNKN